MARLVSGRQRALFITASVLAALAALLSISDSIEDYFRLRDLKAVTSFSPSLIGTTRFLGAVFLSIVSAALVRGKTRAVMMVLPLIYYFVPSILLAFSEYGRGMLFGFLVPDYWLYHYQEILFTLLIPLLVLAFILLTVLLVIPTRIPAILLLVFDLFAPLAYVALHRDRWYLLSSYQWSNILFLTSVLLTMVALPVKKPAHHAKGEYAEQ